jgi:hypothetical protein
MQPPREIEVSERERAAAIGPRSVEDRISRIARLWSQRGAWATLRFLFTRIFRHEIHWIYTIGAVRARAAIAWKPTETFRIVDAGNIDTELNPALEGFLGGPSAVENLCGIRNGDLLFLVTDEKRYVHRGYALRRTRQKQLLGEDEDTPMIAYCYTAPWARGRGLYQRALVAEADYLQAGGFRRVVIETDPSNIASQKGILAAGFEYEREVRVWILLNSLVFRVTRDRTGRHFRMFAL